MLLLDLLVIATVIDIMNDPDYEAGLVRVNWGAVFFYLFILNGIIAACYTAREKKPPTIYTQPTPTTKTVITTSPRVKTAPTIKTKIYCPYCGTQNPIH